MIARFGVGSEQREAMAQSLEWLLPMCRAAGIAKVLINGGFVSNSPEPNDVDCVLLQGPAYVFESPEAERLREGLPFLEIKIVVQTDYDFFAAVFFASDRNMIPKGMLEVTP